MQYRRCGESEVSLSTITLGIMVREFSAGTAYQALKRTVLDAVEAGITSIDLAAGYGRGAIEEAAGQILKEGLSSRREELVIATKGGWANGTRKALTESLDQSLYRLGLDYVDIFYHHAPDPNTPFEVTAGALDELARSGKTRYIGISNYSAAQTREIMALFREAGTPCIIHQAGYNMLHRWPEDELLGAVAEAGLGSAIFGAVSQGLLAQQYVEAGPAPESRAAITLDYIVNGVAAGETEHGNYPPGDVRQHVLRMLSELSDLAAERNQTLSQLAVSWVLRHPSITTVLVGISNEAQLQDALGAAGRTDFTAEELERIESIIPSR